MPNHFDSRQSTAAARHRVPRPRLVAGPGLTAADVRRVRFRRRPWWRVGGLDPDEVAAFLWLVARELERRQGHLRAAQAELDRIKAALREWQSAHPRNQAPYQRGTRLTGP